MDKLQIALIIGSVLYLAVIFWLLKKNKMSIRYSLLWLASGAVMLLFACFPYLAKVLRAITGVQVVSNLIFLLAIVFMLIILLSLTSALSALVDKVKRLTQANALLEERVRRLEKQQQD
ncbi:MAG: DUF2304 domain-containing protein [Oscillospiraceae bacterium]|nr:DUF2304 domain-containing protein [Oscillospiraceae bacterium]